MSTVPYTFANQTGSIPLSELDINFSNVKAFADSAGYVTEPTQIAITAVGTLTSLNTTGNITGGNINTGGVVSATGNVQAAGFTYANGVAVGGSGAQGIQGATGAQGVQGVQSAQGIQGATGSGVSTKIINGTSEVNIGTSNGNANISIDSTSNVVVFTTGGASVIGNISATGNITGSNLNGNLVNLASTSNNAYGDELVGFKQSNSSGFLTAAVDSTVNNKLQEWTSVKDFGATGNGISNEATYLNNSNNASFILIPAGSYNITSDVTFTKPVTMLGGAVLTIQSGVTVTFNGGFAAGIYQVFNCIGTGVVVFDWSNITVGYPEWWGGSADGATDNYAAITACLTAVHTTQLQLGDYITTSTIKITNPHRWLIGAGQYYTSTTNQTTRLLVTNGSSDVLQVGPDNQPGTINDFQQDNVVKNLYLARTVAPVISSACNGLKAQFTLNALIERVKSAESIYSFQLYGNVYIFVNNCAANRASAGTGAGTDIWYGFYVNGYANIGAAGGNASAYINYCSAGCNIYSLQIGQSSGFYLDHDFTDCFLESPETVSCNVGINIIGNGGDTPATNTDLQIKNPINDAFTQFGIYCFNANRFGSIAVQAGYYGPAAAATAAFYIDSCLGSVRIDGGQFVMFSSGPTTRAILIIDSDGTIVMNPQILESNTTGVEMSNSNSCFLTPLCKNYTNILAAAVTLNNASTRNYIAPFLYGSVTAGFGVQLIGATNTYNEINCTGINPAALSSSAYKLNINGNAVTTTGLTGTNLASGVMA